MSAAVIKLRRAIYSNLDSLQDLQEQAEDLQNAVARVNDAGLTRDCDRVIEKLGQHIDTTGELIQALKKALN